MSIVSPKKLIEVALPLEDINAAAAKEKNNPFLAKHPRSIHTWWARRPFTAARAVIFAQMVNDPGGQRGWAKGLTKEQAAAKREHLFNIIRNLVKWENTNNEEVLKRAREAIWESWRETCALNKGKPGFDPNKLPAFHDPFAGGGAIPLEAQRLGLESYASDLNPVAVMINKAMIEIPPKFAGRAPVGPEILNTEAQRHGENLAGWEVKWPGATGLAEDLRRYGNWMREEAKKRIGHLYPPVELTAEMTKERPDLKPYIGKKLTVIAWLWARTVKSPNPQFSDVDVPLVSSFILSSKKGKEAYVEPVVEGNGYRFVVKVGKPPAGAEMGTKAQGRSANFNCVMSKTLIGGDYIKSEGCAGRMGARLMAVVCEGVRSRVYLSPIDGMEEVARGAQPTWRPTAPVPRHLTGGTCVPYGLDQFGKLFTDRQLVALNTFSDLVKDAQAKATADAKAAGWEDDGKPLCESGTGATAYGDALAVYLTLSVSRWADFENSICCWNAINENVRVLFARQAIPMSWDFAEVNPYGCVGNIMNCVENAAASFENLAPNAKGSAQQEDATTQNISKCKVISTDPPYYDNIGYADLSDFFYMWIRRGLKEVLPNIFVSMAVPKMEELVATPYRHGGKVEAESFFLDGMSKTMGNLATLSNPAFPVTIYYAFKQSETDNNGTSNAGWETFLQAVISSGFVITGTWPMRTEKQGRAISNGTNALASSIVLVCRKRPDDAETISRAQFARELRAAMFDALEDMTNAEGSQSGIAAVDLAQAAIGPGMGVYSKYAAVLKSDGSKLSVHEAMIEINKEVDRFLHPDGQSYDPSTNFFVTWFETHGYGEGPFGEADVLARAKGTTVKYVVESGVAESSAGKMRILHYGEYPDEKDYDPRKDDNLPLWEACHRVIRELEKRNRRAAAALLAKMPSMTNDIRQLAYYLYTYCEKHGDAANARAYNALITSWSEIMTIMSELGGEEVDRLEQCNLEL